MITYNRKNRVKAPSTIRISKDLVHDLQLDVDRYKDLLFAPECSYIVLDDVLKEIHGFVFIGHKPTLRWIKISGDDLPLTQGFIQALLKCFRYKNKTSFLEYTFYQ